MSDCGFVIPENCLQDRERIQPELICTSCTGIVRDPVQSFCGHRYCTECLVKILRGSRKCAAKECAENDEELECDERNGEKIYFYPDAFVKKQVSKITALCKNHSKGCGWKGTLVEWEKHIEQCDYGTTACPDCEEVVPKNKWKEHEQACPKAMRTCPLAEFGCTKEKMPLSEWNRHNIQNSGYHLQLMLNCFPSVEKKTGLLLNPAEGVEDCVTDGVTEKKDGGTGQTVVLNSVYDLQKHKDILDQMADIDLVNMVRRLDSQKRLEREMIDKEIVQLQRKVTALEERAKKLEKTQEDFGFRPMLEESHSYNGELIWRIPNIKQRQEDAKSHKFSSINSHFYTFYKCFPSVGKKVGLLMNPAAGEEDCVTDGVTEKNDGGTDQTVVFNSVHDLQKHKDIPDQKADIDLVNMVRRLDSQKRLLEEKVEMKDKEIVQLQRKVNQQEENKEIMEISRKKIDLEERYLPRAVEESQGDFGYRPMLEESHSYNGELIWRIPNFKQCQEDAKSQKFSSIYSLPFYTSRYGYKLCLRLYPYGDGSGKGTHLSLFIVIMRGEYDDNLEWPYRHKVTFQLLNLKGGKDIIDAFRADPESSSFKKPVSDMNVATGCPCFAQLDTLQSQGFVANDTVYIRAKVESCQLIGASGSQVSIGPINY